MKYVIFCEDIYDDKTLVWRENTEYKIVKECENYYCVISEDNNETTCIKICDEGSLFDVVEVE